MGWARGVLTTKESRSWSTRYIDKFFGHQGNELSKYLRTVLLITTDNRWSKDQGICKKYQLNQRGYNFLSDSLLGLTTLTWQEYLRANKDSTHDYSYPIVIQRQKHEFDRHLIKELVNREYGVELKNLQFNYKDQSQRLWHPIQNIKREFKKEIFKEWGLKYNYDIASCAPRLLQQYSQKQGLDLYLFAVIDYINNKTQIRQRLAKELELPIKDIKIIINALFCGARLGIQQDFAISQLIKHDPARMHVLKEDEFIKQLRADIKEMWQSIEQSMTKITKKDKKGNDRKVALSSKRKWQKYFELERSVLNEINEYLYQSNNPCFLEHDGFVSHRPINQEELIEFVRARTGFIIALDFTEI
jgi:hypothetical protein